MEGMSRLLLFSLSIKLSLELRVTFRQSKQLFLVFLAFQYVAVRMHMCVCVCFGGKNAECVCLCFGVAGVGPGGLPPEMVYKKREKEEKLCSQKSNDSLPKIDLSFNK